MHINFQGQPKVIRDPNICPHCHIVNKPHNQVNYETRDTDNILSIISIWKCSNDACNKIFVALYKLDGQALKFSRFLNGLPKGPDWPRPINDLISGNQKSTTEVEKSRFIKTYLQSLVAESSGLDELAGMGYRKAIEYLVKDWAIQGKPEDKEKIQNSWLGSIITNYFTGELKEILERATWLGNDQAHYNKIFEEFDIDVLKELIELIMVELDRQYKLRHYLSTIQKK